MGRHLVVGLGPVEPSLVTAWLGPDTDFEPEPDESALARAEGAIVRAAFDVDAALLDRLPALRVIARTGVGVERVDLAAATARGIPVAITPGANARAVAEGTIALVAALVKRLPRTHRFVADGEWAAGAVPPTPGDFHGSRYTVVGYGRIGRLVAGFAQALGFQVHVHDPFAQAEHYPNVTLEQAVTDGEVLSLHAPGGQGALIDRDLLLRARPGLILVNAARGGLVGLDDLHEALDRGVLGGVGLDVFEKEPAHHHPLFSRTEVLLSPHITGLSAAASAATFQQAAQAVADALAGRPIQAIANTDVLRTA